MECKWLVWKKEEDKGCWRLKNGDILMYSEEGALKQD